MRLLVTFLLGALAAAQQNPEILLRQTFETGTSGWVALGPGTGVKAANHALTFTYEPAAKQTAAAFMLATPEFAHFAQLHLRIKSDYDTALAVALTEKVPGGRYLAWFWAPANTWQNIELTPADFVLADRPKDPPDPDGKLDIDSLAGLAIFDLAQVFGTLETPDFPIVIARPSGTHNIQVEDFQLLRRASPRSAAGVVDMFDRDFLQWVTLGGMDLKLSTGQNPLGTRALEAHYEQAEGQFELLTRRLSNLDLSKATRLSFDIASQREATLILSLEQKGGRRHNLTIYPPGAREVFHVNVKLSDFEGTGKLDPSQLKTLTITDITAAAGGATASNTIWIGKVETLPN
jgi:hypothetical protein